MLYDVSARSQPVLRVVCGICVTIIWRYRNSIYYALPLGKGALSDCARLTSVCLSRTSGLCQEQRGLGRLKLAEVGHVTRDSDTTFKATRSKVNLQVRAYCGDLPGSHTACYYYAPPLGRGIKQWCCLTSVYLSRTSGLSREQRGLGRLTLVQR